MKKWMLSLICLGYIAPSFATLHDSFLITGQDINEVSLYDHGLEAPNFFTKYFPVNLNPNLVIVPRTNSGFMFGVMAAAQHLCDNQTDYVIQDFNTSTNLVGPNSSMQSLEPANNVTYGVYLGYIFPYTGRDVRLEASYFSGSTNDTVAPKPGGILWTPLALFNQSIQATRAFADYKPKIGQALLTYGQYIFAGSRFRIHPALGVKAATITRDVDTTYEGATDPLGLFVGNSLIKETSEFTGVGPAVKLNAAYFFAKEFAITGHLMAAILIGSIDSDIQYSDTLGRHHDTTSLKLPGSNRVVPNFDGKLGLLYRHQFCGSLSTLEIELGYDFDYFFNAFEVYRSAGGVYPFLAGREDLLEHPSHPMYKKPIDNLALVGPYLSIGVSGISCPDNAIIDPVIVSVPRFDGGFVLGIGASYLEGDLNQPDYAIRDSDPILLDHIPILPGHDAKIHAIESNNSYGALFRIGYIFRKTPYDVMLNIVGNNIDDDEQTPAKNDKEVIWPILLLPTPAAFDRNLARRADAHLRFNYGAANLEFGQSINACDLLWMRVFAGLQYARFKEKFDVTYKNLSINSILPEPGPIFQDETVTQKNSFSGLGPRVGLDLAFPFASTWALTGQVAGGFLVGSVDVDYIDKFFTPFFTPEVPSVEEDLGTGINSERQFSPFLDLKVALSSTWNFFGATKWTVDLGYMATHYFNALTTFRHINNNSQDFIKEINDVTFQGPYLMITAYGIGACPPDCQPRCPYTVIVPELKGGLELAVEYFSLQPQVTNVDFATVDPENIDLTGDHIPDEPSSRSRVRQIKPGFDSGYEVHLGYIFPLSANDISINWASMSTSDSESVDAPSDGVLWTITNGNIGPTRFPVFAKHAKASVDFNWDTENVEFGRRVIFHKLMTRFFAGIARAKVNEDISIEYREGITFANKTAATDKITQINKFHGVGPRLGVSADLNFACYFSVTGLIATDLLMGRCDNDFVERNDAGESDTLNPDERDRCVPSVQAKVGLAATAPLYCSQVSFEIGYETYHYFRVKDSLRFTDFFSTFVKEDQDIGFSGPYGRIQINF